MWPILRGTDGTGIDHWIIYHGEDLIVVPHRNYASTLQVLTAEISDNTNLINRAVDRGALVE